MASREPAAFISYVRSDDDHDAGRITELRQRLEGEVKMQTGRTFHIFQDRNDIRWGQQWKERIEDALLDVTFLIPIVTPSYFQSHACRTEFDTFLIREKAIGENRLILPIYYVTCDEMEDGFDPPDPMANVLKTRNWADWRRFRFESLTSPVLRVQIESLAVTIKTTMKELERVFAASKENTPAAPKQQKMPLSPTVSLASYLPEVPVARKGEFSEQHMNEVRKMAYYAYTTEFDEVITPREILQAADAMKLHSALLGYLRHEIDCNEQHINAGATELSEAGNKEGLAISFLVDNSGSMRGDKILGVACWTSIISNILSQSNIACEVLGFTTRAWRGGQSRELWIKDGKPQSPGRLNDLRYIVYKSFNQTFQEADTNFAAMLREGLLKENIDGEAMLWAYSRMKKFPVKRKILFILSDGAPVDDSTLSVNPGNFLEAHTVATVKWLKDVGGIELYGVGVEHDVSRYYGPGTPKLSAQVGADLLKVVSLAVSRDWAQAGAIQRQSLPEAGGSEVRLIRRAKRRPSKTRSIVSKR